jgi:hypothetical protein
MDWRNAYGLVGILGFDDYFVFRLYGGRTETQSETEA